MGEKTTPKNAFIARNRLEKYLDKSSSCFDFHAKKGCRKFEVNPKVQLFSIYYYLYNYIINPKQLQDTKAKKGSLVFQTKPEFHALLFIDG